MGLLIGLAVVLGPMLLLGCWGGRRRRGNVRSLRLSGAPEGDKLARHATGNAVTRDVQNWSGGSGP